MTDGIESFAVASYIRPLAIVVFQRQDGAILMAPGFDQTKGERFYRPLGGGIEFCERAEDAARREILEELGADIEVGKLLGVSENIFMYRGQPGHEMVWVFEGRFLDSSFYKNDVLVADEGGSNFEVHWVLPQTVLNEGAQVYPEGLRALLGW